MKINILTLFPEMFEPLHMSMIGRAEKVGILEFNVINIRDYTLDKNKRVDDTPFGGGAGMVMQVQPVVDSYRANNLEGRVIYMSPRGRLLDGNFARELSHEKEITILCGHYEGIDERALEILNVEEVSVGDYILTGGELAAMVLIDVVARFIEGVLSGEESVLDESIYSGLLEAPQYTKPREIEGMDVPEVLLNGNHKLIALWRFEEALKITKERRCDLFDKFVASDPELTKEQRKILEKYTVD